MIYPMIPPPTTTFTPDDEKEVRLLLRDRRPRAVRKAQASLYAMPASAAADLLAKIADGVVTQRHARRKAAVTVLVGGGLVAAGLCLFSNPAVPVAGAGVALNLAVGGFSDGTRAARRAALLLAERDDYRAIAPLARLWEVCPSPTAARDNEQVEHALTRLLTALTAHKYENVADDAVRDLLARAFPLPGRKPSPATHADLPDARADLLLSALRYLAHATPGKDSALSHDLIARIAAAPVPELAPNRATLHETAALCLDPAYNATPLATLRP